MAEIYKKPKGSPLVLEKFLAKERYTQEGVRRVAESIAANAEAELAAHRDTGDSQVIQRKGRLDRYVILDDTRGDGAANKIEYGRFKGRSGSMRGLAILADAANKVVPGSVDYKGYNLTGEEVD